MKLLDGKYLSLRIRNNLKTEVVSLLDRGYRRPCFVIVLLGDDIASKTYVSSKIKNCKEIGYNSKVLELSENITENELIEEVQKLNDDDEVDGFIVQLPLPKHIREEKIIENINPNKDVDGFHPANVGRLLKSSRGTILSVVAYGVLDILKHYNISYTNKKVTVIGRDNLAGIPVSMAMSNNYRQERNATVTICHKKTKNIEEYTKTADIIIISLDKPLFLKKEMVKDNVIIIDVGNNWIKDSTRKNGYRVCGDVDFEDVKDKCSYITPVPGGMGPMTIAMLMKNTMKVYKNKFNIKEILY